MNITNSKYYPYLITFIVWFISFTILGIPGKFTPYIAIVYAYVYCIWALQKPDLGRWHRWFLFGWMIWIAVLFVGIIME